MTQTDAGKLADEDVRALQIIKLATEQAEEIRALRTPPTGNAMREALTIAIQHIEHMAAWITEANREYHPIPAAYSFEGLGEDMPGIKAALAQPQQQREDELPDELTPPVIDHLFARDDLYTARAVFARLRNFGYKFSRSSEAMAAAQEQQEDVQPNTEILTLPDSAGAGGEMRAALEPFAKLAEFVTETQRDSRPFIFGMDNVIAQRLTIGDLRRAKAALSPHSGKSEGAAA